MILINASLYLINKHCKLYYLNYTFWKYAFKVQVAKKMLFLRLNRLNFILNELNYRFKYHNSTLKIRNIANI